MNTYKFIQNAWVCKTLIGTASGGSEGTTRAHGRGLPMATSRLGANGYRREPGDVAHWISVRGLRCRRRVDRHGLEELPQSGLVAHAADDGACCLCRCLALRDVAAGERRLALRSGACPTKPGPCTRCRRRGLLRPARMRRATGFPACLSPRRWRKTPQEPPPGSRLKCGGMPIPRSNSTSPAAAAFHIYWHAALKGIAVWRL